MSPLRSGWVGCCVCLGVLGAAVGCSGDDFESSGSGAAAGADGGGSGGSSGNGGVGGAGGSGGSTGGSAGSTGGSGGTGGTAGSGGSGGGSGGSAGAAQCSDGGCGDGKYCHSDGSCRPCSDTSELSFDAPVAVTQPNLKYTGDLLAPRVTNETTALFFVVTSGFDRKLHFTTDFLTSPGQAFPAPFDLDGAEEYPLLAPPTADGALQGVAFFFDRVEGKRQLYGSKLDSTGKSFEDPVLLPAPFNDPTGADYSMAFAPAAQRAWWMSTREGVLYPKLYTASTAPGSTPVPLPVPLVDPNNCQVGGYEYSAWVSLDGSLMLFQSVESFPGCTKGNTKDLFSVSLTASGQAEAGKVKQLDVNLESVEDAYPSMSFDMCWLYFSSKRNAATKLDLYRARRK